MSVAQGPQPTEMDLGNDLVVRQLSPGVWLHVAFSRSSAGNRVPSNGLLVTTGEMTVMVDTGWSRHQTEKLLAFAEGKLGQPVEHVILTHAHEDRLGGIGALADKPIIVHGHAYTARLARLAGHAPLHWTFEFEERVNLGGETVDLLYPGPGHSPDNIVVYFPRRQLLFGGCLIKSASARGLGHVNDADLSVWPKAVRRVIERYRDVEILIPGHGAPGGVELLSHTMELLETAAAARE
jgi:metallo-beta-lactamase class B